MLFDDDNSHVRLQAGWRRPEVRRAAAAEQPAAAATPLVHPLAVNEAWPAGQRRCRHFSTPWLRRQAGLLSGSARRGECAAFGRQPRLRTALNPKPSTGRRLGRQTPAWVWQYTAACRCPAADGGGTARKPLEPLCGDIDSCSTQIYARRVMTQLRDQIDDSDATEGVAMKWRSFGWQDDGPLVWTAVLTFPQCAS